jgi:hypothetical protein
MSMRSGAIPFQFDLSDVLARARREIGSRVGNVTLNLPFVSISVSPKGRERQVAREIVIRLKDRRVLSAWECCDNCIEGGWDRCRRYGGRSLTSRSNSRTCRMALFLLLEVMALGIRQFLTYEQLLKHSNGLPPQSALSDFLRPLDVQQAYFDALEILRGHLSRCLGQVAAIAGMDAPSDGIIANYQGPWQVEAYQPLAVSDKS